ncbi:MAG: hypothetical protein CMF80_00780 [Candidatus Marinimicrobia bacterium]|nr:hypothetical protein [Candidatus Neomarinimicrobiota bacterium]
MVCSCQFFDFFYKSKKKYFMIRFLKIMLSEFDHFKRSPFKIFSLLLYTIAIIYGCQNGYTLYKKHNLEISNIKTKISDSQSKMMKTFDDIESGSIEKPRRDPTTPYWAVRNTSTYSFKYPSKLMVFSIGQAEQYGYYKYITNWSTVFDEDLAHEIANPERLAIGTIDYNFIFLYLTPILLIILLFNIGGLEKDLKFENLILLNNISKNWWIFSRFSFYYVLNSILIICCLLFYVFRLEFDEANFNYFLNLFFIICIYLLCWFAIFYTINIFGNGSLDQSIKMVSIWLIFCIVIPGSIHQASSIKYPTNYMLDYLNVSREKSNEIFSLSSDSLNKKLMNSYKFLKSSTHAKDSIVSKSIINRSVSAIINDLNKNVNYQIESKNEKKNKFINSFNIFNPVTFCQNKINKIAETDYYSYKKYRFQIQSKIDDQINMILLDTWNKIKINKIKYLQYIDELK